MRFLPPQAGAGLAQVYRAADVVAVPSYNESFGLVALEAQAVRDAGGRRARSAGCRSRSRTGGRGCWSTGTGRGRGRTRWRRVALDPARRDALSRGAVAHAHRFSWDRTTDALLGTYEDAAAEFARRQSAVLREAAGLA